MTRYTLFLRIPGGTYEVAMTVQETTLLRTCVKACIQRFGLATIDAWGRPLLYRLHLASGGRPLPLEYSIAQMQLPDGMHLILTAQRAAAPTPAVLSPSPRRSFLVAGGVFAMCALTGFGAGVTTVLAQQFGSRPARAASTTMPAATPIPSPPSGVLTSSFVFGAHQQTARSVAWSPDGTLLASASDDGTVLIWDLSGNVHQRLVHPAPVRALAWSPGGKRLVTAADTTMRFFEVQTGTLLALPMQAHHASITSVAWSQGQGQPVVSGAQDQRAVVWSATTYQPRAVFTQHHAAIEALSCQPRSSLVASASQGGAVRIWNVETLHELHGAYQPVALPLHAIAFAPSGNRLALGGDDGHLRIWNDASVCSRPHVRNGEPLCTDAPLDQAVEPVPLRSLAWSPDGRFLATGDDHGLLAIWHVPLQQPLVLLASAHHAMPILSLSWAPDQSHLVATSGTSIVAWRVQLV